jgi:hypothetical protein
VAWEYLRAHILVLAGLDHYTDRQDSIYTWCYLKISSILYAGVEVPGSGTATVLFVVLSGLTENEVSDLHCDEWHVLEWSIAVIFEVSVSDNLSSSQPASLLLL